MADSTRDADGTEPSVHGERFLTIPNVLGLIRLLGAGVLVGLALAEWPLTFLGLFLFLALTDWVDGKLAILLDQRTIIGARLDSVADAALYAALLFGSLWLRGDTLQSELVWILPAVASYALTSAAGLVKFGRWPSYHTRAAKTSWLLVTIGAVSVLAGGSVWPLRIAMVTVLLTNLEATLITLILPRWTADVPSCYHAWRRARRA